MRMLIQPLLTVCVAAIIGIAMLAAGRALSPVVLSEEPDCAILLEADANPDGVVLVLLPAECPAGFGGD